MKAGMELKVESQRSKVGWRNRRPSVKKAAGSILRRTGVMLKVESQRSNVEWRDRRLAVKKGGQRYEEQWTGGFSPNGTGHVENVTYTTGDK